jgi:hypothetical protein
MSKDKTPALKDAKENVWFRLATMGDDHETNRRLWNGYMGWKLNDENKAMIKDRDGNPPSFPELSDEEKKRIEQHFDGEKLPNPNYGFFKLASGVNFSDTKLPLMVDFSGFIFPHFSRFSFASFGHGANFSKATFAGVVFFTKVSFGDFASFANATFGGPARFEHTKFKGEVDFNKATFGGSARFQHTKFKGEVNFTDAPSSSAANTPPTPKLDFSNATFGGRTDFTGRHFAEPPLFFEAKLHEHTYFDEDIRHWPKAPKIPKAARLDQSSYALTVAREHIKAYQRLSLLMRDQQKREDKHLFDSLEARARRAKEGPGSAFFLGSYLYQGLANYGYGLWRAVIFWLANMGLGAGLLLQPHLWGACSEALSGEVVVAALIKSLLNAHPFLVGQTIETWTNQVLCSGYGGGMIELVQGILGAIFFFFLLLTLRNRFRF